MLRPTVFKEVKLMVTRQKLNFANAGGVEQRYKSPTDNIAEDINCARQDPVGNGWLFDRGLEPWWQPGSTWTPGLDTAKITALFGRTVDSLFVWSKQSTEEIYVIIESGGYLYYWLGNKGGIGASNFYNDLVIIQTGRHIPKLNEAGTQYIPVKNRLLIINGYDKPIWFYGRNRFRDYSFTLATPSPEVLDIEPEYIAGSYELRQGIASPDFSQNSRIGIGDSAIGKFNNISYKISFITDTGSESPLSSLSSVSWETVQDAERKFGIMLKNLPVGGDGVVARRIYRTKNQKTPEDAGAADSTYFYVNQINDNSTTMFIDVISDSSLVDVSTSIADTSVISNNYSFGALWNGRVWLAGGSSNPTKVIYSKPGLPEQFGAADYFDVGNSAGGAITGLVPYYNNLIVLRQRAIDIIRIGNGGLLQVSQLHPEIGTVATNTAKLVPGVGLVFLSIDGLYAVQGGLDGGSAIDVTKISNGLTKETDRINKAALARATAVYSSKEREYWVHYAEQGHSYNSRGIVYHSDAGKFSLRHAVDGEPDWMWGFAALAVDVAGNIIIGTRPHWTGGIFSAGSDGYLVGLHVWCGGDSWGKKLSYISTGQASYNYNVSNVSLPTYQYESNWFDFGDNSKKYQVFNVECELLSFGNIPVKLMWGVDNKWYLNDAGERYQAQTEYTQTTSEDAVLGADNKVSKNYFVIGKSNLQEPKIIRVRWDVQTGLCSSFKFKLTQQGSPFHILSWCVGYGGTDMQPLNQTAGSRKGNQ